jgi:hypothetical protein
MTFAAAWMGWLFLHSPLWKSHPPLLFLGAVLAVLTLLPMWRWLGGQMTGFPLLGAYAMMHIPAYLVPFLEGRLDVLGFSANVSATTTAAVCLYLTVVQSTGVLMEARPLRFRRLEWPVLRRKIPGMRESGLMWMMMGVWWIFTVALNSGLLPTFGAAWQVVRVLALTPGLLAVFYFFFLFGKGVLEFDQKIILVSMVLTGVALDFTSGYLIGGGSVLLLMFLAYIMGAKRVPIASVTACALVLSFLHAGKSEMRQKYWNFEDSNVIAEVEHNPLKIYSFWLHVSWDKIFGSQTDDDDSKENLLHRSSLAQMLALVISETPGNKPFLHGQTYKQIPLLMVPRIAWKNKPRGNLPTETLALYYGVQTEQTITSVSIALGQIAEAWANFGWMGIVLAGAVIGLVLSLPSHFSQGCSINQFGFLISAVFLASSYNLEMTMGPWLITLFNAAAVGAVGLYIFSRDAAAARKEKKAAVAQ